MKRIQALFSTLLVVLFGILPLARVAADSNLIANPSFETASGSLPASWSQGNWGTNTATFTYENTGHTGTRSATVALSNYQNGDAKWYFAPVTVTPGAVYNFSDWYKSTAASEIDAVVTSTTGATSYLWEADTPVASAWTQASFSFTAPANAKTLTFFHAIASNGSLTTDDYSLAPNVVTPPTAPTVSVTAPANNATVSGTQTVTATAGGAQAITSVQFKLDNVNLGAADTTAPYSASWNTTTATNGSHTITAVAGNSASLSTTSIPVAVTVNNVVTPPTVPTVSITAPANNATVSGTQPVTATAGGTQAITSVKFSVDSTVAATVTIAPYSFNWDTTQVANGSHTITALATNSASLTATATATVNVNNVVTPPPTGTNLIANPSVETSANGLPTGWQGSGWGTNTAAYTYENTGHTGSHSVKTTISAYTNGDAKWYFNEVAVTPGQNYSYSNWYMASVDSEIDAQTTNTDGSVSYYYVASVATSPSTWAQAKGQFVAPANAKTVTFYQVINKVGYIQVDDASFGLFAPAQFNRGIVSVTLDDGWRTQYTTGMPIMDKYGVKGTFYIITDTLVHPQNYTDYMSAAQIQTLQNDGQEIASHTVTHPHLPQLTVAKIDTELSQSKATLQSLFGTTAATDFATPYGEYNAKVITEIKKYYASHRSTDDGFNSKDNFDAYNIVVQNVDDATTPAQVAGWVTQAQQTKTWLVLVYHTVEADPNAGTEDYSVTPANFDAEMSQIKSSGIAAEPVNQALAEVKAQL
ncbi:MAG TPA: Ig-like domain-containing protein [Patescibacteria group bacterium]|nr:Ig-like domain-containing protein [Patescibacteria group bacterium]